MSHNDSYVAIGLALGPHGQRGELRAKILTEFPERFKRGAEVYIDGAPYTIESSKINKETAIIKLGGIDTPDAATLLSRKHLEIPQSWLKELPPGATTTTTSSA
jgi:ribosomal 30S subunit maturation factor RimM